jgi:hypothetical protein
MTKRNLGRPAVLTLALAAAAAGAALAQTTTTTATATGPFSHCFEFFTDSPDAGGTAVTAVGLGNGSGYRPRSLVRPRRPQPPGFSPRATALTARASSMSGSRTHLPCGRASFQTPPSPRVLPSRVGSSLGPEPWSRRR